jgi:hypothetical protein
VTIEFLLCFTKAGLPKLVYQNLVYQNLECGIAIPSLPAPRLNLKRRLADTTAESETSVKRVPATESCILAAAGPRRGGNVAEK